MQVTGFWKGHLDKLGIGGALFAALCCLGFPALLSILTAVGLGFLIRDAILIPMLVVFLALTLYGLYLGMRRHGNRLALVTGSVGAAIVMASIWFGSGPGTGAGIVILVSASLINVWSAARLAR